MSIWFYQSAFRGALCDTQDSYCGVERSSSNNLMHVRWRYKSWVDERISSLDDKLGASESKEIRSSSWSCLRNSLLHTKRKQRNCRQSHIDQICSRASSVTEVEIDFSSSLSVLGSKHPHQFILNSRSAKPGTASLSCHSVSEFRNEYLNCKLLKTNIDELCASVDGCHSGKRMREWHGYL